MLEINLKIYYIQLADFPWIAIIRSWWFNDSSNWFYRN